jgi:Xaa-Pro dipeptidase
MSIYEERIRKVRRQMESAGVDLLVLAPSPYMFYISGIREQPYFGGLKGPGDWLNSLFISQVRGPVYLIHWMVHRMLARIPGALDASADIRVIEHEDDHHALLARTLREFDFPPSHIAVADRSWAVLVEALRALVPGAVFSMASDLLDGVIAVKDEEALRYMREVTALTDAMYARVLPFLRRGVTEEEVALEVDYQFRKLGAEGNAFRSSVVFTRPGDLPPTVGKQLQPGDSIMFDVGAVYGGYCSDFGRSAFCGEPPRDYLNLHDVVLRAQAEGIAALKAGHTKCEEVVTAVQGVLAEGGYGEGLIPQVGHAIGVTVHESPLLIRGEQTVVQAGMTFTVEPTIRVPGKFSNRVEDIVLVTPDGAEYLSNYPRALHIVD